MFLSVLRLSFLLLFGALLTVGLSPAIQRKLAQRGYIPDQYRYGDLYNKTNLAQFKEPDFRAMDNLDSTDRPATKLKNVHLYTLGDSFTDIDTSFFAGEKNTHVWVPTPVGPSRFDPRNKNVIVIEFIERVLQERMKDKYWRMYVDNLFSDFKAPVSANNSEPSPLFDLSWGRFGSDMNSRLEFIFFNNSLALRAKELKAKLLLDYFGRATGARLSPDRQHVFYDIEVDTTYELSSFRYLSDAAIDSTVDKLNRIGAFYQQKGFDKVYISLIPNKSTVLAPNLGRYNHQIERIEKHPDFKIPFISTIDTIRHHPEWYHLADGHWNKLGKRYWVRRINALAAQ